MYGGPEETRTLDLSDANRTLSQLSYRPKYSFRTGERLALHAAYPNIIAHLSENARLFSAWCGTFCLPPEGQEILAFDMEAWYNVRKGRLTAICREAVFFPLAETQRISLLRLHPCEFT